MPAGKFESEQAYATRGVVTQVVIGLYKGFFIQDVQGDGNAGHLRRPLRLHHQGQRCRRAGGRGVCLAR